MHVLAAGATEHAPGEADVWIVYAQRGAASVEADGERRPLRISVGLAAWQTGLSATELLEQARLAGALGNGAETTSGLSSPSPPVLGRPGGPAMQRGRGGC